MRAAANDVKTLIAVALTACALAAPSPANAAVASRPEKLKYQPLKFEVPKADAYKAKLKNGITVYVVEDHSLPLVNVNVTVKVGAFLDPAEKTGRAGLTGTMMRKGGAGNMNAEEFDEKADALAADISSYIGDTQGGAGLNCLTTALDPSMDLLFAMMRSPKFQQSRIDVEKSDILEDMKQRNDDAGTILRREWNWRIYGEDHFSSRSATKAMIDGITRDDLVDMHTKYWRPDGMIIAVAGDISKAAILADLDRRFADWKVTGPPVPWPPPPPQNVPKAGLYHIEKEIPQGKVYIGQTSTKWDRWDNPDNFALQVMNDILGGGGFTSRITKKVRSDEGLAYSAGSSYNIGVYYPLDYRVSYQSKNPTVALAAKYSLEEIKKMREGKVTDEEMRTSKGSFIDAFPRNFDSPARVVGLFATDDYIGRPHAYWETYRASIDKVTPADVQKVAKQYLTEPSGMVFLVVGKWSEIEPGDADKRASMKEFFGGQVQHLPLRDPMTLKPMP